MEEIWEDLNSVDYFRGYEYSVSNLGRVRNKKYKILKTSYQKAKGKNTYERISIVNSITKIRKSFRIHRIVLIVFSWIDGHENMTVNHKDKNTHNNNIDNLEWMTVKENIRYSQANITKYGDIKDICEKTSELQKKGFFITEAAKQLGIPMNTLYDILTKNGYSHVYKRKEIDTSKVKILLKNGYNVEYISKELSISMSSVYNIKRLIKRGHINDMT